MKRADRATLSLTRSDLELLLGSLPLDASARGVQRMHDRIMAALRRLESRGDS